MLSARAQRPGRAALSIICAALAAACGKDPVRTPQPALVAPLQGTTPQTSKVTTVVPVTPTVRVTDAGGNPVAGIEVEFAPGSASGTVTNALDTTDAQGLASVGRWTLGTTAGAQTLIATARGVSAPATFTVTATPDVPAQLTKLATTDNQTGTVNTALATPPVVIVRDQYGNPAPGATVTFAVAGGGGTVTGATAVSDGAGRAAVGSWRLGTASGENTLLATSPGMTSLTFTATALPGAATQLEVTPSAVGLQVGGTQQLTVRQLDQFRNPVSSPAAVAFSSNDPAIATVSASGGLVTAVARGTTSIRVTAGTLSATVPVFVAVRPVGTIVASPPLSSRPYGVAISPAGVVYVSRLDAARLARADLPSTALTADAVAVGSGPVAVAFSPDGATAYVANQSAGTVSFVNVASNSQTATVNISSGSPISVIVSPDGARVYVGTGSGSVVVIDAATRATSTITLGGAINGLALHPTQPLMYASTMGGTVYEVSTATNSVTRTFATGGTTQGLAVSPDGGELWIANESGPLIVWNLTTGGLAGTVAGAPNGFGLAITRDGSQVYVASTFGSTVWVVDRATRTVTSAINTGGAPRRIAFDAGGGTAVITNEAGFVTFVR